MIYPPSGVRCTLRAGCSVPSERSVIFALLEACYSPRPKRITRPARSVLLAPLEACYSPRPKRVARPVRSVLLAPSEACCSPRPKRVTRPVRSELLAPLGACCSPRPKRVARHARHSTSYFSITVLLNQFFSVAYTELVVKKADIIFNCVRTYKKLVANLTVGFPPQEKVFAF